MRNLVCLVVALTLFSGVATAQGKKKSAPASKADMQMLLDAIKDLQKTMDDNHKKNMLALGELNTHIKEVQNSLKTVQQNLAAVKNDIAQLKINMTALQGEMASVKADIAALKGDIGELKGELGKLQHSLNAQIWQFQHGVYEKPGVPTLSQIPQQGYATVSYTSASYTTPSYYYCPKNTCYYCQYYGAWWQYSPGSSANTYWRYVQ